MDGLLMRRGEVLSVLGISKHTLRKLVSSGALPQVRPLCMGKQAKALYSRAYVLSLARGSEGKKGGVGT